jgi:hypothetical protein
VIDLPAPGERIAIAPAGRELELELRARTGFRDGTPDPRRLGYCGREFRTYGRLRVGEAAAFYGGVCELDRALLDRYLRQAGLDDGLIIRRMKRGYHRALVLALIAASSPDLLVVEGAEDFNEAAPAALLEETIARAPRAIVTCEDSAVPRACSRRAGGPAPA